MKDGCSFILIFLSFQFIMETHNLSSSSSSWAHLSVIFYQHEMMLKEEIRITGAILEDFCHLYLLKITLKDTLKIKYSADYTN